MAVNTQDIATIFERQGDTLSHWQCIALASRWVIRATPSIILTRPQMNAETAILVDEAGLVLAYLSTLSEAKLDSRGLLERLQSSSDTALKAVGDLVYDGMMFLEMKPKQGIQKMGGRLAILATEIADSLSADPDAVVYKTLASDLLDIHSLGDSEPMPVTAVKRFPVQGWDSLEQVMKGLAMALNTPERETIARHNEQFQEQGVPSDEATEIGRKWFLVKTAQRKAAAKKSNPRNKVVEAVVDVIGDVSPIMGAAAKATQNVIERAQEIAAEPPTEQPKVPELKMESDAPWQFGDADYLGFDAYADALTTLIEFEKTKTPLTIAINAPWGAGKTSLVNMIKDRLAKRHEAFPYVIVDFNAWLHDEATNLGGAFSAEVIRGADRSRTRWHRFWWPIPWKLRSDQDKKWSIRRIVLFGVVGTAALFSLAWSDTIPLDFQPLYSFVSTLTGVKGDASPALGAGALAITLPLVLKAISWVESLTQTLGNYVSDPQAAASSGSLSGARNRLKKLLEQATRKGKRRMVIFIDDAERCQVPRSVEILEAINQLLAHPNVVTVIMGDMPAIEAAAAIKYKDLANFYNPGNHGLKLEGVSNQASYGRQYLQKIIQLQFDLPPHDPGRVRNMMAQLANESENQPQAPVAQPQERPDWFERIQEKAAKWLANRIQTTEATPPQLKRNYTILRYFTNTCFVASSLAMLYHMVWAGWNGISWIASLLERKPNYLGYNWWFFVGLMLFSIAGSQLDEKAKQLREQINDLEAGKLAEKAIAEDKVEFSEIESSVQAETPTAPTTQQKQIAEKAHQQVQQALIGDSQQLVAAYHAAEGFLPLQPRGAKRLLNSLRVMLFISRVRRLPLDIITPEHLGKWAAMRERWPQLAQLVLRKPLIVKDLEAASAAPPVFKELMQKLLPDLVGDRDVIKFFKTDPKLGPVMKALLHFDPAMIEIKTEPPPAA